MSTDDNTGVGTGHGFFELGLRGGGGNSPAQMDHSYPPPPRTGPISFNPGGSITVELQDGTIVTSPNIDSSISRSH